MRYFVYWNDGDVSLDSFDDLAAATAFVNKLKTANLGITVRLIEGRELKLVEKKVVTEWDVDRGQ